MAAAVIFYHAPGSSSMGVHIALHEVGAPFETRLISLPNRAADPPEFRTLNPEGKVPVLLTDAGPLTEVAAILYYLARTYPDAQLFPAGDIAAEAQVISWMSFIASTLHPARRRGQDHARAIYTLADQRLADQSWAIGNYSIADIHLFRLFWRFKGSRQGARLGGRPMSNEQVGAQTIIKRPTVQVCIICWPIIWVRIVIAGRTARAKSGSATRKGRPTR
jgi:glutathione S-transferase